MKGSFRDIELAGKLTLPTSDLFGK